MIKISFPPTKSSDIEFMLGIGDFPVMDSRMVMDCVRKALSISYILISPIPTHEAAGHEAVKLMFREIGLNCCL
jgi:hypothetical protein